MVDPTGVFDMWSLLVESVFGGFWLAVIGLTLVMFIIMGFLGRISIYSCMWYLAMFIVAMTLGYGYTPITILLSLSIIIALIYSIKGYQDRGGQ